MVVSEYVRTKALFITKLVRTSVLNKCREWSIDGTNFHGRIFLIKKNTNSPPEFRYSYRYIRYYFCYMTLIIYQSFFTGYMSMGEINSLCRSGMGSPSNSVNGSPINRSPVLPKSNTTSIVATKSSAANAPLSLN